LELRIRLPSTLHFAQIPVQSAPTGIRQRYQGYEQGPLVGPESRLLRQEVGHRPVAGGVPDGEGGDELVAGGHSDLEGEQTEEEVAGRGVSSAHRYRSRPAGGRGGGAQAGQA
jgi:hypothetical protein